MLVLPDTVAVWPFMVSVPCGTAAPLVVPVVLNKYTFRFPDGLELGLKAVMVAAVPSDVPVATVSGPLGEVKYGGVFVVCRQKPSGHHVGSGGTTTLPQVPVVAHELFTSIFLGCAQSGLAFSGQPAAGDPAGPGVQVKGR